MKATMVSAAARFSTERETSVSPNGLPTPTLSGCQRLLRLLFEAKKTNAEIFTGGMRSSGFEPPRYFYRQPLKLVRLPVPPRPPLTTCTNEDKTLVGLCRPLPCCINPLPRRPARDHKLPGLFSQPNCATKQRRLEQDNRYSRRGSSGNRTRIHWIKINGSDSAEELVGLVLLVL
jgi:hypothetical protein